MPNERQTKTEARLQQCHDVLIKVKSLSFADSRFFFALLTFKGCYGFQCSVHNFRVAALNQRDALKIRCRLPDPGCMHCAIEELCNAPFVTSPDYWPGTVRLFWEVLRRKLVMKHWSCWWKFQTVGKISLYSNVLFCWCVFYSLLVCIEYPETAHPPHPPGFVGTAMHLSLKCMGFYVTYSWT